VKKNGWRLLGWSTVALREEAGGEESEEFKGFKELELLGSRYRQILYTGETPDHPRSRWGLLRFGMEVLCGCRSS
jgi:hypothetical protein